MRPFKICSLRSAFGLSSGPRLYRCISITTSSGISSRRRKITTKSTSTSSIATMETIINNSRQLSSLSYTNCKTRIVSLKELDLPETASDEEYREIYHRYIQSAETNTNAALLRDAVESIRHGLAPPVAFPTETVYGLGADATNEAAIQGIFAAKGRPSDNPLIVHAASVAHLERLTGERLPEIYRSLAQRFWPGPLTILLPVPQHSQSPSSRPRFAKNVHPGQSTIGFRIPSSKYARFFIAATDRPIAGPSANSSGKPSPTTAQHVFDDLKGKINFILDAGHCDVGVESTVVDGLHDPPLILRPGGVSLAEFVAHGREQGNRFAYTAIGYKRHKRTGTPGQQQSLSPSPNSASPSASTSSSTTSTASASSPAQQQQDTTNHYLLNDDDDTEAPRAPGMKYRHYAPKGRLILFSEPAVRAGKVQTKFDELLAETTTAAAQETGQKNINIGIISCHWASFAGLAGLSSSTAPVPAQVSNTIYAPLTSMATLTETKNNLKITVYDVRIGSDIKDLAHSLFGVLRLFDDLDCRFIFAETVQQQSGSGSSSTTRDIQDAVIDRIEKAAAERVD
ncbi:Threonylcarbamoyl-AMP synthase [Exophiala dermatitidis]